MGSTLLGIAIIIATVVGPVAAVVVTLWQERRRAQQARRLAVFRDLMRTRRANLSGDYVSALNLIEIEFHGVSTVINAFQALSKHLNTAGAPTPDWSTQRGSLQTKLLHAMAKSLGYGMEQLELLEGGYLPQAWQTTEEEQQQLRRLLIDLLSSRRSLPVSPAGPTPGAPYPPAPSQLQGKKDPGP
jgi:hypothetical protein